MAQKTSTTTKVAEGLGLAALAAGAAAGLYLYGKDGKTHRKDLKAWSKKARLEMVQKIKGMKSFGKTAYEQASQEIMNKYAQAKNIDPKELAAFGAELKGQWDKIAKQATKLGSKKTVVKKTTVKAKTAAKKKI